MSLWVMKAFLPTNDALFRPFHEPKQALKSKNTQIGLFCTDLAHFSGDFCELKKVKKVKKWF